MVSDERSGEDCKEGCRNDYRKQLEVADAVGLKDGGQKHDCCGDRRGSDRHLRGDDRDRQRARGADVAFLGDLRDHRQGGKGGVPGACEDSHQIGDDWCKVGDVLGVFA